MTGFSFRASSLPSTLLFAAVCTSCTSARHSPSPAPETDPPPAAVAQSFLDALRDERWGAAAGHVDLDRFASFVRDRVRQLDRLDTAAIPTVTPEQMMVVDPEMPRVVAEYLADRGRDARSQFTEHLLEQFAGVPDRDSLLRLPVREAASRWLEAQDLRSQLRRARAEMRERGCEMSGAVSDSMYTPNREVVGAVVAASEPADTVAYVLFREQLSEGPPSGALARADSSDSPDESTSDAGWYVPPPEVVILQRAGGTWKVIPPVLGFGSGAMAMSLDDCVVTPMQIREP